MFISNYIFSFGEIWPCPLAYVLRRHKLPSRSFSRVWDLRVEGTHHWDQVSRPEEVHFHRKRCSSIIFCFIYVHVSGDLFQQPKAAGLFAPGMPSPPPPTTETPDAQARREQYQGTRQLPKTLILSPSVATVQSRSEEWPDAQPRSLSPFSPVIPKSLGLSPPPPSLRPISPAVAAPPAKPPPPARAGADADPPNMYKDGTYWKLLVYKDDRVDMFHMVCL